MPQSLFTRRRLRASYRNVPMDAIMALLQGADDDEDRDLEGEQETVTHATAALSRLTHAPAVISSSQSSTSSPFGARCCSSALTLRA